MELDVAVLDLSWTWQPYTELQLDTLHAILAARQEVFVLEQGIRYVDADRYDRQSWHLCAWAEAAEGRELAAYLRVIPLAEGVSQPLAYKVGRVLTRPSYRGRGLGIALMQELLQLMEERAPCRLTMAAQSYLEKFYARFGFRSEGEQFLEEGIEHIRMSLGIAPKV